MKCLVPLFGVLLVACATPAPESPPALAGAAGVPGDSLITVAPALRNDALANLATFSQATYGCAQPRLVDTKTEKVDGQLAIDGAGRLHAGRVAERWQIDACGAPRQLKVLLGPDGKGGSYVAFGEIKG